jgi:hypothetical protein
MRQEETYGCRDFAVINFVTCKVGGACSTYGRDEKCIQNCSLINKRKRPLARRRLSWMYIIKMDVKETGYTGVE